MIPESERGQIREVLKARKASGEEILMGETEHFVVVYRGGRDVYRRFGSYLDTHPMSLAQFLEIKYHNIFQQFQLDSGITGTHLVEVGRLRENLFISGVHKGDKHERYDDHNWETVRFSDVKSNTFPGKLSSNYPQVYQTATHEVLGHSVFQPILMPQISISQEDYRKNFLGFASEGFATYIENLAIGIDSHKLYGKILFNEFAFNPPFGLYMTLLNMNHRLVEIDKKWGDPQKPIIFEDTKEMGKMIKDSGMFMDLKNCFNMGWQEELSPNISHYPRGASLNRLIFDTYGPDIFRQWTLGVNRDNYGHLISDITGLSRQAISQVWKSTVLKSMQEMTNNQDQPPIPKIFGGQKKAQQVVNYLNEFT